MLLANYIPITVTLRPKTKRGGQIQGSSRTTMKEIGMMFLNLLFLYTSKTRSFFFFDWQTHKEAYISKEPQKQAQKHTGSIQEAPQGTKRSRNTIPTLTQHLANQKNRVKREDLHLQLVQTTPKDYKQKNFSTYSTIAPHCQRQSYFFPSTPPKRYTKGLPSTPFCASCPY